MNRFRTLPKYAFKLTFLVIVIFLNLLFNVSVHSQSSDRPVLTANASLFSDIDTTNQEIYVFLDKQLWVYALKSETWTLRTELSELPHRLTDLEFGLTSQSQTPTLWTKGVGSVYEIDTASNSLKRIDLSFPHKNQFSHIPFFRNGNIYAFGGYGFWTYKNYISYFKPELKEWHLHTPDINSPLPSPRIAKFGFYNKSEDALYIYGGTYPKNNRYDDKNIERLTANDIWKYSFITDQWEYLSSFTFDKWEPYVSTITNKVGHLNAISKTTYSPHSKNWYLPFHNKSDTDMLFHLIPFNIESQEVYKPVEIPIPSEEGFFISSYFYNPKTASFVFLGMDHLTNRKTYPLRIEVLPEDSVLQLIQAKETTSTRLGIVLSFGVILILGFILFYKHNLSQDEETEDLLINSLNGTSFYEQLNEHELKLFEILKDQEEFTDSHELEERAWPDIKNYDYRRKLRNESINSINEKFEAAFGTATPIISRKKDPKDNRRYLYGLNRDILDI